MQEPPVENVFVKEGTGHKVFGRPRKMDQFLFLYRSKWEDGVLGVLTAPFSAQRIQCLAPLSESSWWKTQEHVRQLTAGNINKLLAGLRKQLSVFKCRREIRDDVVKATHLIANETASASKPQPTLRVSLWRLACCTLQKSCDPTNRWFINCEQCQNVFLLLH